MSEEERRLDELLGAYALDAVSDEERREVEQYLLLDPRARAEVADHREVATMLAWTGASAPDGLWDRIAAQLEDTAPAPSGELAAVLSFDAGSARRDADHASGHSAVAGSARRRRSMARSVGAWVAASAAAALIAVFAVTVVQSRDDSSNIEDLAKQALEDRDSSVAKLVSADGALGGEAVIDQDGHGYLIARSLPPLTDDRTYQLWGVIDGQAISLGVLGSAPEVETFTAAGNVTQLVITNEVSGGVISNGNPDGAYAGIIG